MISEKMLKMFELVHEYQICEVAARKAQFVVGLSSDFANAHEISEIEAKGESCRNRCAELQAMMEALSVTAAPFIEYLEAEGKCLSA